MTDSFAKDIVEGLSAQPKRLYSKYFYDEIGDDLFVQIMNMPEYYLTDAELEIFTQRTKDLIQALGVDQSLPFELIELGAGDGTKTVHLLKRLVEEGYDFTYTPIDISANALEGLADNLTTQLPRLNVTPQQGEYFEVLQEIGQKKLPKVVLFLGSNIGNLTDEEAHDFIAQLSSNLKEGDKCLLGVDLIKSYDIVMPAYNDAAGITRAFNLNLLTRINRELGGNFNVSHFEHVATYDESEGIMRSYLKSTKAQEIHITSFNQTFTFEKEEEVLVEISRKYNDEILSGILKDSQLTIKSKIMDSRSYFADYILEKR